jgi:protease-4
MQELTDKLGQRFLDLLDKHRSINQHNLIEISTARVFLADEALKLGLVDKIGYLEDAVREAKMLADLPEDAKIVVYRRTEYPDDNLILPPRGLKGDAAFLWFRLICRAPYPVCRPDFIIYGHLP